MDRFVVVTPSGHAGHVECQVVAFGDVPGCPDTSEPVVVLSFGSVGLVEKTVVGGIFTTSDSTAFHFPVPIAQIGIRIHFATAVVNVSTCLITSVRIGSGFYAAVVTGFPVIL